MTRRLGWIGSKCEANSCSQGRTWVFLPRGYTSQLGIRVSIRRAFGSTKAVLHRHPPSRRNHRKLGSRTLPLTTALFTLPGVHLHWARAQAMFHGFSSPARRRKQEYAEV